MQLVRFLAGVVIGAILYAWLFSPKVETNTVIKEVIVRDTIYTEYRDTIIRTREQLKYLIDTIYLSDGYEYRKYSDSTSFEHGSITWNAETKGELVDIRFVPSFDIPTITEVKTVTETNTIVKQPRGLYVGAGVNSNINYSVGANYLDQDWLIGYEYLPQVKVHSVGVRKRVF